MSGAAGRTVLVSGGGITGLTTALCLAAVGFRVDIFEQAHGFETIGAGLQISPNAFRVLDRIGISGHLKRVATGPDSIRIVSAYTAREIVSIPLGAHAAGRYGAPYLVVHRADLHQVLANAVNNHPDVTLHLDSRLEDFTNHANGVTALVYQSGNMREHSARCLIAADGVGSVLRTRRFGAKAAVHSGLTAWRGLIAADQLEGGRITDSTLLWLAANAHAVCYSVRGGRYLNLVVITPSPPGHEAEAGDRPALKAALSGWHPDFLSMLDHRTRWTPWPLFHMPGGQPPANGSAVLAGDAAHAMLPFSAQGAAMGIEDGWTVACCLARSAAANRPLSEALAHYQQLRRRRVARVARLARANGRIYHLAGPLALARDAVMRVRGGAGLLHRLDWLYNWQPDDVPHQKSGSATA